MGVKIDWGCIMIMVVVFQIEQVNVSIMLVNGVSIIIQDGCNCVCGLELVVYGELQCGLWFNVSGIFFDVKQYYIDNGINDGKDVGVIFNSNFNFGLDWDMLWLQGLVLNMCVICIGLMWYSNENKFKVLGWICVDIGVCYIIWVVGQVVIYCVNIENLFDKNYWLMQNGYVGMLFGCMLVLLVQVDF